MGSPKVLIVLPQWGLEEMDNMTCIRFTEFLLFLLLNQVCSEEPKLEFRAKDENFVLGYCFGVDYVAAYRYGPQGYRLLGNSSDLTNIPALHDRLNFTIDSFLLGLQINGLIESDSGLYKRECWMNHSIVRYDAVQLLVCREESSSKMITVNEDGRTELLCNSTLIGKDNISVHWYHEIYPADMPVLFLDTTISQDPLLKELQGVVEARDNGSLLVLDKTVLQKNVQFYCLVINDGVCLSFQNMYLAGNSESRDIFVSQGERVVLNCPSDNDDQQLWHTPLGEIKNNSKGNNQMYISAGNTEDFSLIIPDVSDEHSGMYSCISPFSEIQYWLMLCSETRSQEKVAYEGESISLDCNFGQKHSKRVLWYRSRFKVLRDSENTSIPDLGDLSGRLAPSNSEDMLTISHLDMNDTGVYGCLVLTSPGFIEGDMDYENYYEEGMTTDEYGEDEYHEERCILKHETILKVFDRKESSEDYKITGIAVGASLVGLLIAVSLVIAITIKRRKAASVTRSDIQMNVDPGCTTSLTGNDDVA